MAKASTKREQALRYLPALLGVAVALALITGGLALLPDGLHEFWWLIPVTAVLGTIAVIGGVSVGSAIGQQIVGDRLEVALKLPDSRWRHGRVAIAGNRLAFEPYIAQLRISTGQLEHFDITRIEPGPGRRPPLRSWPTLSPGARILTLTTTTAPIEVVALPSRLETLQERLHPQARD